MIYDFNYEKNINILKRSLDRNEERIFLFFFNIYSAKNLRNLNFDWKILQVNVCSKHADLLAMQLQIKSVQFGK